MEKIGEIFLMICNMSVTAGIMVMLVIAARQFLGRAPKSFSYFLWGIVGFRLICPYSVPGLFSLFNLEIFRTKSQTGNQIVWNMTGDLQKAANDIAINEAPGPEAQMNVPVLAGGAAQSGTTSVQSQITGGTETFAGTGETAAVAEGLSFIEILALIWIVGMVIFLIYQYVSYRKLKRRVATAVRFDENVYECDNIQVPFVMGIICPKIYLPFRLGENERRYIVMHEQYHIRRHDHLVKCAATILLAVYWFHPLIWAAYHLMCKDMEMSCDEKVIGSMGNDVKEEYSRSLLGFAVNRRIPAASPLAFGETSVKTRIRNVLRFRQTRKIGTAVGVVICMITVLIGCANGEDVNYLKNLSAGNKVDAREITYEYAVNNDIKSYLIYKETYTDGMLEGYEFVNSGTFGEKGIPRKGKFVMERCLNIRNALDYQKAYCLVTFEGEREEWNHSNYSYIDGFISRRETHYLEDDQSKVKIAAGEGIVLSAWSLARGANDVETIPCESFMSEMKRENVEVNDSTILHYLVFSDKTEEELKAEYKVSPYAKQLVKLRTSYIGDAPAVGEILDLLGSSALSEYEIELATEEKPYVLRVNLKKGLSVNDPSGSGEVAIYRVLENRAVMLFAMIENLDQVEWSYPIWDREGNKTRLWKMEREEIEQNHHLKKMMAEYGIESDLWEFAAEEDRMDKLYDAAQFLQNDFEMLEKTEDWKWKAPDGTIYPWVREVVGTRDGEEYASFYRVLTNEREITFEDVEQALQTGGKSDKLYVVQ